MTPKTSIVTPSYNQGQFLEETIVSVLNQNYPNLEYIIIDGGSTDNSVDIIKKYEDRLAYWISEKDRGQTHAINKGFKQSTGEILNWLNSDDLLLPGALEMVAEEFVKNPEVDFCFGDFSMIDEKRRLLFSRKSPPYCFRTLFYGRQLSCQPAVFFRRSVLERLGYLDETLSFCMDLELWIRAAFQGSIFCQVKWPLAMARIHSDSKTAVLQKELREEHKAIVHKYQGVRFRKGSVVELVYYTLLNRSWRFVAAVNRCIHRGDFSFAKAHKAFGSLRHIRGLTR